MFYLINSIPIEIRIILLVVGEILLIYGFIKCKNQENTPFKMICLVLLIFDPIFAIGMIISQCMELGLIQGEIENITRLLPFIFSMVFSLSLLVVAIISLVKGKLTQIQRNMIIFGLLLVFGGVMSFIGITILERFGVA